MIDYIILFTYIYDGLMHFVNILIKEILVGRHLYLDAVITISVSDLQLEVTHLQYK